MVKYNDWPQRNALSEKDLREYEVSVTAFIPRAEFYRLLRSLGVCTYSVPVRTNTFRKCIRGLMNSRRAINLALVGLGVKCSPLDARFVGSNPAEIGRAHV